MLFNIIFVFFLVAVVDQQSATVQCEISSAEGDPILVLLAHVPNDQRMKRGRVFKRFNGAEFNCMVRLSRHPSYKSECVYC